MVLFTTVAMFCATSIHPSFAAFVPISPEVPIRRVIERCLASAHAQFVESGMADPQWCALQAFTNDVVDLSHDIADLCEDEAAPPDSVAPAPIVTPDSVAAASSTVPFASASETCWTAGLSSLRLRRGSKGQHLAF
ncbi:unnamed protein product [Symbiodinium microadriaticum]|nr:unnamed protein product [Symbiodinium microadriaticum]